MSDAEVTERRTHVLAAEPVEAFAALFDVPVPDTPLVPPLWHWGYFLPTAAQRELGPDGHPLVGVPAPPDAGMRRMFAGGRVTTHEALHVERPATRVSRVTNRVDKQGRSGPLTFLTVRHEIRQDDALCVTDEQDIVYRPAPKDAPAVREATSDDAPARSPRLTMAVDARALFRFSALTYNAHRIHYDRAWAEHEGYAGLVIHGPLQAMLMAELARRNDVDLVGRTFTYRLQAPLVAEQTVQIMSSDDAFAGAQVVSADGGVSAVGSWG